jgi:hypothetical protein
MRAAALLHADNITLFRPTNFMPITSLSFVTLNVHVHATYVRQTAGVLTSVTSHTSSDQFGSVSARVR